MYRILLTVGCCLVTSPIWAQTPLKFQWTTGEQLSFSVTQVTTITETAPLTKNGRLETTTNSTKLTIGKLWQIQEVDTQGVATMTLSISSMKQEISRPVVDADGKIAVDRIVMDSGTPEGAQEMASYLNKPLVTAKIDSRGHVVEAKATGGDAATERLRAELPFRILLPEKPVGTNEKWERTFTVKLDPPVGTGEVYEAKQSFVLRGIQGNTAVVGMTTSFPNPPTTIAELQPLLPWQWNGDVFVDPNTGRYLGAKLTAKKSLQNHQGEGTKFEFESIYTEAVTKK